MKEILMKWVLRAVAWLTWSHIQWLMVQCLGNKGLYHAAYRMAIVLSTGPYKEKTWDSITLKEALEALNPDGSTSKT
jgi:hypothetical protein